MLILHAGFAAERLWCWGERAAAPEAQIDRKRRGRWPAAGVPLPYAAGPEELLGVLRAAGVKVPEADLAWQTATVWLPTVEQTPVPSSPLIAPQPPEATSLRLAPWQVNACGLPAAATVELLAVCQGKELLAPGIVLGPDLAFWTLALRLAGALTAQQRFLPGVQASQGCCYARWEPVLNGADAQAVAALAARLPLASRALQVNGAAKGLPAASQVLQAFLGRMVDQLVRLAVHPAWPAPPKRPGRPVKKAVEFDSLHEQWLHALQSPDGLMVGPPAELEQLQRDIHRWRRPVAITATAPFRLCFRLEEPEENSAAEPGTETWFLRLLLQGVADPSLLIPVPEAWQPSEATVNLLRPAEFNAKEYILVALGQSARLYPALEAGLHQSLPTGLALDTPSAYAFLTETAMVLEQAGFGVLLPAWWSGRATKMRLAVRGRVKSPKLAGGTGLRLDEVVQFDWQLALGDEDLTLAELKALAKLKAPLVKVRGQWVQLNAAEIQAALALWKQKAATGITAREALQMALGGMQPPGSLEFAGLTATGWVGELLAQLQGQTALQELDTPPAFGGTLRPYQVRGYSWLHFLKQWGLGACLADDMGLGKTVQTLALIAREWQVNQPGPVLLVCPTSVVGNWQKEAARFTPHLPVLVHHGLGRAKGKTLAKQVQRYALVISSYALLHRDFEALKEVPWAGVILDEAQNIKNPETKQAKAARALPAGYKIALTGTPVENNVGDLWSIMEFLNPGFLGSQAAFKRRFFIPIQAYQDQAAAQTLQRLTRPFILRRLKTDPTIIADLPEKNEMKVYCHLTKEQASLYTAVVDEAARDLQGADGIQRKGMILGLLTKLKQVCNHPAHFLGDNSPIPQRSGKLSRLTEMLDEILQTKDRALLFTQFTEMGSLLQRYLQETFGREVLFLHGGTPQKQRDVMVARFQAEGSRLPLFILSLKAGGTGLNLTGANHVFHFDRWWNPAVENQATDRVYRIGQTRNVQVHKFLCVGTLEEKIDEMIERKKEVAAQVVGTGEGWLTELSTGELLDLMALRREALED
jgi:SNF2 family DNA or RNA helicase